MVVEEQPGNLRQGEKHPDLGRGVFRAKENVTDVRAIERLMEGGQIVRGASDAPRRQVRQPAEGGVIGGDERACGMGLGIGV